MWTVDYVLCFDGGTESIRVGLIDSKGNLLSIAHSAYPTNFPYHGWAEQNPGDWWSALVHATRACLEKAPINIRQISGLCLDATTCTIVTLGRDMQPLRPALLWMDVRAADQANRIFATKHPALRYSEAGCNAEWMPSKVLWLAENEPEIYEKTTYIIEYTDWLIYRFTGQLVLNLNTTTQRWYYNNRDWGWPADLFEKIGLHNLTDKFPKQILPAGKEVGIILPDVARLLGLPENIRVFQGGGDAFIGLLGMNVTQPGKIGLLTGSSNVIGGFVENEFYGKGLFGAFPDAVVPGLSLVEGGQASTGANLAWFKRTFATDLPDSEVYKILDQEAKTVPPGSNGVIALDYLQGNRTPYTDSKARGAFWGLSLSTTRGEVFRAIMESVAFGTNLILNYLESYDFMIDQIFACGGATRSDVFMQIYADICGKTIFTVDVLDAPLMGDAILAFTGMGIYPDFASAAEKMVRTAKTYQPNPESHTDYQFYFDLYKDTYHQLKGLMHQLSDYNAGKPKNILHD